MYGLLTRRPIDKNNDSAGLSKTWIVFSHGIVEKLISEAEFSAEDLAIIILPDNDCGSRFISVFILDEIIANFEF